MLGVSAKSFLLLLISYRACRCLASGVFLLSWKENLLGTAVDLRNLDRGLFPERKIFLGYKIFILDHSNRNTELIIAKRRIKDYTNQCKNFHHNSHQN